MARYGLTLITAPTLEPVTEAEAFTHCNIVASAGSYYGPQIRAFITAAREKVETDTGRALMTQTWDYTFDLWPCGLEPIYLPKAPVSAITSVKHYDTSNVQQTIASSVYKPLLDREPGEIRLKNAQSWPALYGETGVITVRFVCGFGATTLTVPESLRTAIKLTVESWFNPEKQKANDFAYEALIDKWRTGDEWHTYGRSVEYA